MSPNKFNVLKMDMQILTLLPLPERVGLTPCDCGHKHSTADVMWYQLHAQIWRQAPSTLFS